MKVRLLKKLRKEIKRNLKIHKNDSEFTLNWVYLITYLKDKEYHTEDHWVQLLMKYFINYSLN